MTGLKPRAKPCGSCPYRCDVPSGVWDASEYKKLLDFDGDIPEQKRTSIFMCHTGDSTVCAGWLGHDDPLQMLSVRLGLAFGKLDPSCASYTTKVPLFSSGAEAAAHGLRELENPNEDACTLIAKLEKALK